MAAGKQRAGFRQGDQPDHLFRAFAPNFSAASTIAAGHGKIGDETGIGIQKLRGDCGISLRVNAPAPEKSQRSYDFYKKAGFEDIGPLLRYFLDKDGRA
jgi:hypothetical protein